MSDAPSWRPPPLRSSPSSAGQLPDLSDVPISHAHARLLAWFWEEPDRPDDSVTVLARTGAIRNDVEHKLGRDLELLTEAATQSSDPGVTICQMQIGSLLHYVRQHGRRDPVQGWTDFQDDGEFRVRTVEFVRRRRRALVGTPRSTMSESAQPSRGALPPSTAPRAEPTPPPSTPTPE